MTTTVVREDVLECNFETQANAVSASIWKVAQDQRGDNELVPKLAHQKLVELDSEKRMQK